MKERNMLHPDDRCQSLWKTSAYGVMGRLVAGGVLTAFHLCGRRMDWLGQNVEGANAHPLFPRPFHALSSSPRLLAHFNFLLR